MKQNQDQKKVAELLKKLQASYLGRGKKEKETESDTSDREFQKKLADMLGKFSDDTPNKKKAKKPVSKKEEPLEDPIPSPVEEEVLDTEPAEAIEEDEAEAPIVEDIPEIVEEPIVEDVPAAIEEPTVTEEVPPPPPKKKRQPSVKKPKKEVAPIEAAKETIEEATAAELSEAPLVQEKDFIEPPALSETPLLAEKLAAEEPLPEVLVADEPTVDTLSTDAPPTEVRRHPLDDVIPLEETTEEMIEEVPEEKTEERVEETEEVSEPVVEETLDAPVDTAFEMPIEAPIQEETARPIELIDDEPTPVARESVPPVIRVTPLGRGQSIRISPPSAHDAAKSADKSADKPSDTIVIRPPVPKQAPRKSIVIRPRAQQKVNPAPTLTSEKPIGAPIKIGKEVSRASDNTPQAPSETD